MQSSSSYQSEMIKRGGEPDYRWSLPTPCKESTGLPCPTSLTSHPSVKETRHHFADRVGVTGEGENATLLLKMMKATIEKSLFKLRQRGSECTGEGYGVESLNCYRESLKDEWRFARFVCRLRQEPTNVLDEGDACFVNGA